jgi:hypothetical protein
MHAIDPETQLRVYTTLRYLEARSAAYESVVSKLKRCCVHGGLGALTELIETAGSLRMELREICRLTSDVQRRLGLKKDVRVRAKPGPLHEDAPEPAGIRGTTDVMSVPDLVSTLSNFGKTGTLALRTDSSMFVFEFQEGRIVHAATNAPSPDMRLGTILVAQNKLTEAQLQASLTESETANQMLGNHLVRSSTVTESDLRKALDVQVHRIFELAFGLRDARFTFVDGSVSDIAQRTAVNTTELLLETARQIDMAATAFDSGSAAAKNAIDSILGK